jgi:hypothetical protein
MSTFSFHERCKAHCIYNLGLGVVAQGHKQVLLGGAATAYAPGQSDVPPLLSSVSV